MGDPRAVVPYHDPHDVSSMYTSEQHLLHEFQSEENPTLSDLYYPHLPPDPNPCLPSSSCDYYSGFPQSGKAAASGDNAGNSFNNPAAWSTGFASSSHGYGQGGLSCPGGSNAGAGPSTSTGNMDFENARLLPLWPVQPLPYSCSCCHVLREIIHMNGKHRWMNSFIRLLLICLLISETVWMSIFGSFCLFFYWRQPYHEAGTARAAWDDLPCYSWEPARRSIYLFWASVPNFWVRIDILGCVFPSERSISRQSSSAVSDDNFVASFDVFFFFVLTSFERLLSVMLSVWLGTVSARRA